MKTSFFCVLLAAAAFAAEPPKAVHKKAAAAAKPSAFDKKAFEEYVRHLFVWPPPIELQIGNPSPSPLAGFLQVTVRATSGKASQDDTFYISKDGQTLFQVQGNIYKFSQNPYQDQLSKLKTEFRPSFGTPGAPVVLV